MYSFLCVSNSKQYLDSFPCGISLLDSVNFLFSHLVSGHRVLLSSMYSMYTHCGFYNGQRGSP